MNEIVDILNSEDSKNPFLVALRLKNELLREQTKLYSNLTPLLDKVFHFLESNNHTALNPIKIVDKNIYLRCGMLYFDDGNHYDLFTMGAPVYVSFRIKNETDIHNHLNKYSFEYHISNKFVTKKRFKKVTDYEKRDMNFNMIFISKLANTLDILFNS